MTIAGGDQAEIDRLIGSFYALFTNTNGTRPDVRRVYDLFIPGGVIVKATGPAPEVYSLRAFVEPRQQVLTDGTLVDFQEAEVSARTDIAGNVAQRHSVYRKSGVLSGRHFEATGVKVFQLVRMPGGWRLSGVAWDDEEAGHAG